MRELARRQGSSTHRMRPRASGQVHKRSHTTSCDGRVRTAAETRISVNPDYENPRRLYALQVLADA